MGANGKGTSMNKASDFDLQKHEKEFAQLQQKFNLTDAQREQFKQYCSLLLAWNEKFNLTTITTVKDVVAFHFEDSLLVQNYTDLTTISGLADVGTGAGFPGLALKIAYPNLPVYLIEVNHKKIEFLQEVATQLGLDNVECIDLDWRTFLRKTDLQIDLFCARASLAMSELVRMFKPSSPYNNARLIYWAQANWQPTMLEAPFVEKEIPYTIQSKRRKYVLLKKGG